MSEEVQAFAGRMLEASPFDIVTLACPQTINSLEKNKILKSVEILFKARPDKPGAYLLLFGADGYHVAWAGTEGVDSSVLCPWDPQYLHLLLGYIHSLYSPPHTHPVYDSSIHSPRTIDAQTMWTIECAGKRYNNCHLIFQGEAWNRRTTVFESIADPDEDFVIIKDSFRDNTRGMDEADYLRQIHKDGVVPGVVTLVDAENVTTKFDDGSVHTVKTAPLMNVPVGGSDRIERTKQRLVMGSKGVTLWEGESVLDILMGVYDFLEAHRWIIWNNEFLYRDVGKNNLLIYPVHNKDVRDKPVVKNPPSFIGRVLGLDAGDLTIQSSRCLMIDFDNASPLRDEKTGRPHDELKHVAGTDPYIARSVYRQAPLPKSEVSLLFTKMPELTYKVRKMYCSHYGQEMYNKYNDKGTYHGGVLPDDPQPHSPANDKTFYHQPRHDVESVYWLLLATFLRVRPSREISDDKDAYLKFNKYCQRLMDRGKGGEDTAKYFMHLSTTNFEEMLHPSLRPLARMLNDLTAQVSPEYAYLTPSPPEDHLHEAFRRILLQQIVDMQGKDIKLDPKNLRTVLNEQVFRDIFGRK
ncbi:hypothetical protein ABKN59_009861 [Abortiporus biennis]